SRSSPEPPQIDRQGHYIGPASGVSFLLRIQKTLHSNSSLSHDSSIFTFGDSPLPDHDPSFFLLPPKVDAERLISRYFDFAQPAHRFLHRPTMERILHEFYETQGEMRNRDDAPTKTALLFIVFAQAQAYMPPVTSSQDNSARYYFAAERQLSKERGAVRLASVQARLVQCFYLLTQSRINHAWSLFGTMAHLAFAIGLNRGRRADPTGTLDYLELESRRRLFWCAYTLDKYLSAALGRPRTFKDEDIDQELPTVIDDEDLHPMSMSTTPSNYPPIMMAPVEHIKLSRMISLILRDLYAIHPPSLNRRIELTAKYSQILQEWRTSPVLSNFLDSPPPAVIYQRQRNVLNLSYFHTILLIHRPFLLSNFASLARISNSQPQYPNLDTARHIRECLDAAMGIVETVDALFQTAQMFRSFWFTQYYAFCAVVVLYIYRIQQHIVEPGKCEGYFAAAQKCQAQLSSISETDCLSKRYCLVLEELRVEAARQIYRPAAPVNSIADTTPAAAAHSTTLATLTANDSVANLDLSAPKAGNDAGALFSGDGFYNGNVPPTPESDVFATGFLSNSSFLTDFSSWGQFDSLVTAGIAGIGVLDGSNGWQNDNMSGLFGFGR
ncbi:fungal-specific transcription factor domain-containing protein, partial [Dendryphion nanum]